MRVIFTPWRAGMIVCLLALAPASQAAFAEAVDQAPAATPQSSTSPDSARPGRYTMVPAEGGFVRLDTETGTVSHCRRGDASTGSVWTCAAIPESVLSRPDPAIALAGKVDALEREVAGLRTRLDDVDARMKARATSELSGDPELDKALNFSEQLMSRFFGMVREMKRDAEDNKI